MGRPRLTETRRGEILAALERCVLRDGLGHTTVAGVAAEAGFQRTLVNHYFGDMETLVRTLVLALIEELTESFQAATLGAPGLPTLLDYLFQRAPSRPSALIGALRASAVESANGPLARMYEGFAKALSAYLRAECPAAPPSRCRSTAFAIVCLSMSRSELDALGVAKRHTGSLRASAESLLDALQRS